jgi:aldehyde dehydrogenase (NAD(P)+)
MAGAARAVTSQRVLDEQLERLGETAPAFAALPVADRVRLAESIRAGYAGIARASVQAACEAKGIPTSSAAAGEEWLLGPFITLFHLRRWIASLQHIERHGTTAVGRVGQTADGRTVIQDFPRELLDRQLLPRLRAEVHLLPGADATQRASFYRSQPPGGSLTLVLGGGNVNAIPPLDVLTRLFNDGSVCLLKMNPVNAYLGPFLEQAFSAAIREGFMAVAYGGAEEGEYLAHHPAIDEILVTGSDRTYDRLEWGPPGAEQDGRKAQHRPLLNKPVLAELGNISPVLVVPGPYSARQLRWQAESIAGGVVNNASFNCNAHKLLLSATGWEQRSELLAALQAELGAIPPRQAYYPGAEERYRRLLDRRSTVSAVPTSAPPGTLPWTLNLGLDPSEKDDPAFRTEPFCAILHEASLPGRTPAEFLEHAVDFVNERVWGTLSATIVIHPQSLRDPSVRDALERAVLRLRYGTVGINVWAAYGFAIGTPWGGHPSSTPQDIQSGCGFVHNVSMLESVEKTVLRQPLTVFPKPLHFPSHRTAAALGESVTGLYGPGGFRYLPGTAINALRA